MVTDDIEMAHDTTFNHVHNDFDRESIVEPPADDTTP